MLYPQCFIDDLKNRAFPVPWFPANCIKRLFLIFGLIPASFVAAIAQQPPKADLLEDMGRPCKEDLLARFDSFIGQQNRNGPGASSYIYFYPDDELEGQNLSFTGFLNKGYHRLKDQPERQFRFVQGGHLPEMKIELWSVPPGAEPPPVSPKPDSPVPIDKATLFDKGWADFNRFYGRLDIYEMGFYDLGCDFPPNTEAFARRLKEDRGLRGHLVVYTRKGFGSKRGNAVARFAIRDIVERQGIPRGRLSFAYGGTREDPALELWLVPNGVPLPKPKPAARTTK